MGKDLTELEQHEEITSVSFSHDGAHLASTHTLQGGASNGWNTALILKGDDVDEELVKALEQIEVTLSMEEFLQRFFSMWSDDAELLTKILGFETEEEYRSRLEDDGMQAPDRWGTDESWEEYKKRNLETRADKVKFVEKANESGLDSLSTDEKIALLEFQSEIEKGVKHLGGFDAVIDSVEKADPENVDAGEDDGLSDEVVKTSAEGEPNEDPSADNEINKTNSNENENDMTDKVIEKSELELQLEKAAEEKATLEKALAEQAEQLEVLVKAEEARAVAGATKLVKSFGFIAEEKQEEVVGFMVKSADAPLVAELLKQANEAVQAAKAEVEEVKKEFGETEHGVEGEEKTLTPQDNLDKSLEDFQDVLKEMADA